VQERDILDKCIFYSSLRELFSKRKEITLPAFTAIKRRGTTQTSVKRNLFNFMNRLL
jgi:hypothetical protein